VDDARCDIGEAVVTPAFDLDAAMVIHAVAPDGLYGRRHGPAGGTARRLRGGASQNVHLEEALPPGDAKEQLLSTYSAILAAAAEAEVGSVALPAIGCGVLGFSPCLSAKIALDAFGAHAGSRNCGDMLRVDVVLLDDRVYNAWSKTARTLLGEPQSVGDEAGIQVWEDVLGAERLTAQLQSNPLHHASGGRP
jgi:O-acetyl-ADP-ribose deacetylase (regulator of RNase III)